MLLVTGGLGFLGDPKGAALLWVFVYPPLAVIGFVAGVWLDAAMRVRGRMPPNRD
jgi:hypothetical protein